MGTNINEQRRSSNHASAADSRPVPSQAEGELEPDGQSEASRPVPSQAEGDVETVEQDLREKASEKSAGSGRP